MKMRRLIFGMAAMVSVSLFLLGCPTDSDDGGGGDTFTDLTAKYPKTDSSDINGYSNSLTIDSVLQNDSTGVVTITLSGTIVDVRATGTVGENGKITGTSSDAFWEASYPYDGAFKQADDKIWGFHF
jgi:hypothetical protein